MSTAVMPANYVRVSENNFGQELWIKEQINLDPVTGVRSFTNNTEYVKIVEGPGNSTHRLILGSVFLTLPTATDRALRRIRLRKGGYSKTHLSDIIELKYSTYIVQNISQSAPNLVLQIDLHGDESREGNIYFTPRLQRGFNSQFPTVQQNIWQEWDALNGFWQAEQFTVPGFPNGFSIQELLRVPGYENARIVDTTGDEQEGYGIRFTVGKEDPTCENFKGYIDAFTIQRTQDPRPVIFDFIVEDDDSQ